MTYQQIYVEIFNQVGILLFLSTNSIGLNKEEIAEEIWKHEEALKKAELEAIVGEALKKQ